MHVEFDLTDDDYMPLIERAMMEDLGSGDITSQIAGAGGAGRFRLVPQEEGILAGRRIVEAVLKQYDDSIHVAWGDGTRDGEPMVAGRPIAEVEGPRPEILAAERVLLNFLQRLCGVATQTARYVAAVAGTGAKIYDTRKTTPGWRALEKFAVRCGGGHNHRMGLYDAILIKDNHLVGIKPGRLAERVREMLSRTRGIARTPDFVEVEVDTLQQLEELLGVTAIDVILLDNFSIRDLNRAVGLRNSRNPRRTPQLEASGRVNLDSVKQVADTGVDRIAIGALTHSVRALDISLESIG